MLTVIAMIYVASQNCLRGGEYVTPLHMYQGSELELQFTESKGERLFAKIAGGGEYVTSLHMYEALC